MKQTAFFDNTKSAQEALLNNESVVRLRPKARHKGWCNAPIKYIASSLRRSEMSVRRSLEELKEKGLLEFKEVKGYAPLKRTTDAWHVARHPQPDAEEMRETDPQNEQPPLFKMSTPPVQNEHTPPFKMNTHISLVNNKEDIVCEEVNTPAPAKNETAEEAFNASEAIASKMLKSERYKSEALAKLQPELQRPALTDLPNFGAWWVAKNAATFTDDELRNYIASLNPATLWARWGAAWAPNLKPAGASRQQPQPPRAARPVFS